jgi:pimeloyl-ACP methyl ester carboxylesterase
MIVDLVQITTRDRVRLDGMFQAPSGPTRSTLAVDGFCLIHGTGGNFYSSTLFDHFADGFLKKGASVLRVNTRGHDGISTAATERGGRRQGAAYEAVDDCRHDLAACLDWLRQQIGPRVGLLGHSMGAVKCLYAVAHEPSLAPARLVALSPPRLSYSWFCSSPEGAKFLETYHLADQHVTAGQPATLLEVQVPLPYVISAAGYVEKYGPDERFNYLRFLPSVPCPSLITLGETEVRSNMAFRETPAAIAELARKYARFTVMTFPNADHFYTGAREQVLNRVEAWLDGVA